MGLESSPTRIEDLNTAWPLATDLRSQGDDHIRNIKAVLASQFAGLGSGAVTVSETDLNDVTNKLVSFNGRTAVAAVPTAGDYDLNDLGDVATGGADVGDMLTYNGTNYTFRRGPRAEYSLHSGFTALVSDQIQLTTADADTITADATIATIANNGTAGWKLTCVETCMVHIALNLWGNGQGGTYLDVAIGRNAGTTIPGMGATCVARTRERMISTAGQNYGLSVAGSTILNAGNEVGVYFETDAATWNWDGVTLSATVFKVQG